MDSPARIAAAVTAGAARAADVLAAAEARHDAAHPRLNALVQPRFSEARAEAATAAAGPLAGVPVSVKECFPVRGLATTLGIEARQDHRDAADAEIVVRLRAAGAAVVGKANVPQAMFLHETDNPVWGRTNHPRDAARGPGGSSGGDAALVAAGVVPLAVGNDLAGSLRQPAHACGVAALVPRSAVLGEGGAIDTLPHLGVVRPRAGFLAATVADLRLALRAVGRAAAPSGDAARGVAGMRIGWWDDAGPIPPSAAVARAVAEAVARLARVGATVVPLAGDVAREAAWIHLAILGADGGADIRRLFAGGRPIPGVARLLRLAGLPRGWRPALAAIARLAGRGIEAEGLARTGPRDAAGLARLLAARADVAARFHALAAGLDAVVCPVSALPALRHGTAARLVLAAAPCLLANLLDLPAGAVPVTEVLADEEAARPASRDPVLREAAACDRGSAGLPVGVQVVACPGRDEDAALDVMAAVEAGADQPSRAATARGI
ncbi:MAG: amidase family protein [Planctomycetaceae bacterium]